MSESDVLIVEGATERNLQNITVRIPKGKLSVICGPSGSGKSTLLFDVVARAALNRFLLPLGINSADLGDSAPPKVLDISGTSLPVTIHERFSSPRQRDTFSTLTGIAQLITEAIWHIGVSTARFVALLSLSATHK